MTVKFWIGQDFDTTHERIALRNLLRQMQEELGDRDETYHVLANYTVGGKQVDLTVLKRNGIIVLELKECVEPFHATENGPWITSVSGYSIETNARNPLQQANVYRKSWMTFLSDNQSKIMTDAKAAHMSFTHVSAFVVISPTLNTRTQNDIPEYRLPWFQLIGLDTAARAIFQQTTDALDFSDRELDKIIKILGVQSGDEELGGSLRQTTAYVSSPGSAPPQPSLLIGREDAIQNLKKKLGLVSRSANGTGRFEHTSTVTILRGWPGVGKTSLAAALAHDPQIAEEFDKVLWASLGDNPRVLAQLSDWATAVGFDLDGTNLTTENLSARMRAYLSLTMSD